MKKLLNAGAARSEITPGGNILPLPYVFSYTMDGVADPIYVRVLDVDNGKKRVLFVTFDMVVLPYAEETMQFICEVSGLGKECILMAATHAHETPVIGAEALPMPGANNKDRIWYAEIQAALKDAILKAAANKKPARMGYGTGKSYININRDELFEDKSDIGNNFERPSDKTLAVVRLEDEEGAPIALFVNYAVHGVVLNGTSVDGKVKISGDLPGRTSLALEEKMDGVVVLWTSGAAGDQNPRIMTQYGAEFVDGQLQIKCLGEAGYTIVDFLTNEHVRDIEKVNKSIICNVRESEIFAAERIATCPGRLPAAFAQAIQGTNQENAPVPDVLLPVRLLTIGDVAFEGIPGELVTSIGTALKEASPFANTMIVTHANKYCGYIPDDWGYEHKTFEANGTFLQQGYAQPLFLQNFAEMFAEKEEK